MPELSGIEAFGLGIGVHWSSGAIVHFAPLDPTFNHLYHGRSIKIFRFIAPSRLHRKLFQVMKFFPLGLAILCSLLASGDTIVFGQSPEQARGDAVRVTVSMHSDGSRTFYNFDNAQHKAAATTTGQDGKVRETIRYELDDAGRFFSAEIFGPDGRLRLKSRYKYDDAGRILEETQSAADGTLQHKIVYSYDSSGKQTGYSVFDASGKLVGGKGAGSSRPSSSPKPHEKARR
jgi:hypothetical protein